MRVVLIEATPWDNAGNPVNVYLAGGGARQYDHRGRTTWLGGVVKEPKFSAAAGFDESGWTGRAIPQTSRVGFTPASKDTLTAVAARQWVGAAIEILVGDDKDAAPVWQTILKGTVSALAIRNGSLELTCADLSKKLDDPFLKARFSGGGLIEGDADIENRIKRRTWGKAFNIEGRILRKAFNVYEFGDPAFPLNAFVSVRDMGRAAAPAPVVLAWQGSIAATLAALEASVPVAGSAVVAPSIACVKWWTQPSGPLTADIQGEVGAGYTNLAASIAERITALAGGPAFTAGTVAAINAVRADEVGIHVDDDSESTASILDRLLHPYSIMWALAPAGTVTLNPAAFANPVETIQLDAVERVEAYRPTTSRRIGYQRLYRKHGDGEISSAVQSSDIEGLGDLALKDTAALGVDVVASNGVTVVTDAAALNAFVSISVDGALVGGGGGQVTAPGLGVAPGAGTTLNLTLLGGQSAKVGNQLTRTAGANNYTASAGAQAYKDSAFAEATLHNGYNVIGLGLDATSVGYANQFATFHYRASDGAWWIYSGNSAGAVFAPANGTTTANLTGTQRIAYDGTRVLALINGAIVGTATTYTGPPPTGGALPIPAGLTLYPRFYAYEAGRTVSDLNAGSLGVRPKAGFTMEDSTGNILTDSGTFGIKNIGVSISSGGVLAGGGGGAVTPAGLETASGVNIRNSLIAIASGALTGIGTGSGTNVANSLLTLSAGGVFAGGGGGSLTALGLEGAFSLVIRNNQIAIASGILSGIGTGNNTAVANNLLTMGSNGVFSGGGGGAVTLAGIDTPGVIGRTVNLEASTGRAFSNFASAEDGRPFSRVIATGEARDGDAVSFGFTAPSVPKIIFLPGGNGPPAGQNILIQAVNLTTTGFTMKAKAQTVTAGATITDNGTSTGSGSDPDRMINRTNAGVPWDGKFYFTYNVTAPEIAPGEPGRITLGLFLRQGGAWVQVGTRSHLASGTFLATVSGAADFGAGNEFGIDVLSSEGSGGSLNSFSQVQYSLGSTVETNLTPAAATAIPYLVILEQ